MCAVGEKRVVRDGMRYCVPVKWEGQGFANKVGNSLKMYTHIRMAQVTNLINMFYVISRLYGADPSCDGKKIFVLLFV